LVSNHAVVRNLIRSDFSDTEERVVVDTWWSS